MSDFEKQNEATKPEKDLTPAKKPKPVRVRNRKPFNFKTWLRELRSELKKVVWPTPKQVINNTLIVVAAVILVGAIVAVFDLVSSQLVRVILGQGLGL